MFRSCQEKVTTCWWASTNINKVSIKIWKGHGTHWDAKPIKEQRTRSCWAVVSPHWAPLSGFCWSFHLSFSALLGSQTEENQSGTFTLTYLHVFKENRLDLEKPTQEFFPFNYLFVIEGTADLEFYLLPFILYLKNNENNYFHKSPPNCSPWW